jgi:hypothetical protein
MKRVIRSDKPVTLLLLFWSHKCDNGAEPRSRIIATSAVKGLKSKTKEDIKTKRVISVIQSLVKPSKVILIVKLVSNLRFVAQGNLL